MGDYFRFDLVFIKKKITKPNFFIKKPKPVQTDRFRFGFLGQKPIQTGLTQFFCLAWFSVFFPVFSIWVQFVFFYFRLIKLKPNRTEPISFFKNLINVFLRFDFLDLISFLVLLTPTPIVIRVKDIQALLAGTQ